jgi:hypothetical protein
MTGQELQIVSNRKPKSSSSVMRRMSLMLFAGTIRLIAGVSGRRSARVLFAITPMHRERRTLNLHLQNAWLAATPRP